MGLKIKIKNKARGREGSNKVLVHVFLGSANHPWSKNVKGTSALTPDPTVVTPRAERSSSLSEVGSKYKTTL